uniref:Uncharacterized protein n=1 Tax=Arundo donax TaxID=35708 RepID=A0A0A9AQ15_ARUDO
MQNETSFVQKVQMHTNKSSKHTVCIRTKRVSVSHSKNTFSIKYA